jgi:hypothetical protein
MDIKGIIKTGSYKNCVVSICNESYLKDGKLHFVDEDDICKFNIKIVNKPHDCKGKKKIGESTYIAKSNISIFSFCSCSHDSCCLSHKEEEYPILDEIKSKIKDFIAIYKDKVEMDSISPIQISFQQLQENVKDMSYVFSFIRISCLCIRVLTESFCKKITNNYGLTARELTKLAFSMGYFSSEKFNKSNDLLYTCNQVIHSVKNVDNPWYYIQKINDFLLFLVEL